MLFIINKTTDLFHEQTSEDAQLYF